MTSTLNRDLIALIAKEDPQYAMELEREYKRAMIVLSRNDPAMFCQYVLRNGQTGGAIYLTPEHVKLHSLIQPYSRTVIWTYPEFGKGIPHCENIPTPDGWVKMGDLAEGSRVFGSDGKPANVTWVSPTHNIRVYDVEFDDGVVVRTDEEHLWVVRTSDGCTPSDKVTKLVTTREMSKIIESQPMFVPLARSVQYTSKALPVDPFSFGAAIAAVKIEGRRIPEIYKVASTPQRIALFDGILSEKCAVFTPSGALEYLEFDSQELADDVLELVRSLGFKASLLQQGTHYRITIASRASTTRRVVRVTEVPSVPTRCIRVDSPDHTFLVGKSYTVTHNCEAAGAKILLANGTWKNIEDLKDCTELLTYEFQTHKLKTVNGRSTPNGVKPILNVQLENGHTLRLTEEHPLFCTNSLYWKRACEFSVGDRILVNRKLDLQETTPEHELPIEETEILGYLLAGEVREKKVFVRKLWKSERWTTRRAKVFGRAMWELEDCDRDWFQVKLSKKADPSDLGPYEYLCQLATLKDGFPIDVEPCVWKLSEESMKRLLTGFFVTAFCDPHRKMWTRGRTVGLGDHCRAPKGFVHKCYETGDMIRRLAMRAGVSVSVNHDYYFTKQWLIVVPAGQIAIFYPGSVTHTTPIPTMEALQIVSIERGKAETWALEIEESEHSYISGGVLSHNTTQMIGHALWKLGKDPNISIGIFQNAKESSIQTLGTIKQYIESSPELHDVFPDLVPGDTWKENAITVRRTTFRRDPSVKAISLGSKFLGDRFDGLILDDIDNPDTVLTEESRKKTEDWVRRSALSRLTDGAWAVAIGNIWHEFDLMHQLVKSGWEPVRHPVMRPDGTPLDPERFTLDRIYHIRDVDQKPVEFERLYMLKERIEGEQRFKQEWIDEALRKGNQNFLQKEGIAKIPPGCRCITGVDIGVKKKMSSDPTVITTILEAPIGNDRYEYQILNIEKGRWNAEEIMQNITTQQKLFSSEVFVESNGAQDFLIQLMNLAGAHFRVNPFNTGRNKYDPMFGVESIAGELAAPNPKSGEAGFGLWYFPAYNGTLESADPEMQELCNEMLAYTPGNHTGDILMSLWIAREGARNSRVKVQESKIQWGRLRLRR